MIERCARAARRARQRASAGKTAADQGASSYGPEYRSGKQRRRAGTSLASRRIERMYGPPRFCKVNWAGRNVGANVSGLCG
jgi:hypothetical protein